MRMAATYDVASAKLAAKGSSMEMKQLVCM